MWRVAVVVFAVEVALASEQPALERVVGRLKVILMTFIFQNE